MLSYKRSGATVALFALNQVHSEERKALNGTVLKYGNPMIPAINKMELAPSVGRNYER